MLGLDLEFFNHSNISNYDDDDDDDLDDDYEGSNEEGSF